MLVLQIYNVKNLFFDLVKSGFEKINRFDHVDWFVYGVRCDC